MLICAVIIVFVGPHMFLWEIDLLKILDSGRIPTLRRDFQSQYLLAAHKHLCLRNTHQLDDFLKEERPTKGNFCKSVIKPVARKSVEQRLNFDFFVHAGKHEH